MNSPAKKFRHENTNSNSASDPNLYGSPMQSTRTGANEETPLFNFDMGSPAAFMSGGLNSPFTYLPSVIPSSRDWSPSMRNAGIVPDNFNFNEALSPGPLSAIPSRTASHSNNNSGSAGGGNGARHKRNGSQSLLGRSIGRVPSGSIKHEELYPSDEGIAIGDGVLDEESQGLLSDSKRALAERLKSASKLGGRYTPDASFLDDSDATRLGPASRNNSRSGSITDPAATTSTAGSGKSGGIPAFPFSSTSASARVGGTPMYSITNTGGRSVSRTGTGTSSSISAALRDARNTEVGGMEEEDEAGSGSGSGFGSQQSAGMSSLLAAAAAESFQYSDGRPDQPNSSSAGNTQLGKGSKKSGGKPRSRAYNGVVSNNGLPFMHSSSGGAGSGEMEVVALEGGGEYSNLSFETGSSGNSQSGSGLGSRHTAPVSSLPSYSTPAMKLTSAMAASAGSAKPISCNCKRSRCLKMYCDCFRLTLYCKESCRCKECANVESKSIERQAAIDSIVERNPEAFKPRVTADPTSNSKAHLTGCHCRKSSCLKKYCECFTGAVPCGERCRCIDCKNAPNIYRADASSASASSSTKAHRVFDQLLNSAGSSRLSATAAPGSSMSSGLRKDSIGSSEGASSNMDVMSAIMNDKRQQQQYQQQAQYQSALAAGLKGAYPSTGGYYDPEMSNLTMGSLSYSREAFGRAGDAHSSLLGYPDMLASPTKLSATGSTKQQQQTFSPPKANTDISSGANSNRSVLDNEEAAEVLSVMNSPNNYIQQQQQQTSFNPAEVFGKYRDTVASSVGSSSVQSGSLLGGFTGGRTLLRSDIENETDDPEDTAPKAEHDQPSLPAGVKTPGLGTLRIAGTADRSDPFSSHAATAEDNNSSSNATTTVAGDAVMPGVSASSYLSPSTSAYNSPVKPRRPEAGGGGRDDSAVALSPMQSLLDLAGICEQQAEEEQRKSQLNSPVYQRS